MDKAWITRFLALQYLIIKLEKRIRKNYNAISCFFIDNKTLRKKIKTIDNNLLRK